MTKKKQGKVVETQATTEVEEPPKLTVSEKVAAAKQKAERKLNIEAVKDVFGDDLGDPDKMAEIIYEMGMEKELGGVADVYPMLVEDEARSSKSAKASYGWLVAYERVGDKSEPVMAIDTHWPKSDVRPVEVNGEQVSMPSRIFVGRDDGPRMYQIGKNMNRLDEYAKELAGPNADDAAVAAQKAGLISAANGAEKALAANFSQRTICRLGPRFEQQIREQLKIDQIIGLRRDQG